MGFWSFLNIFYKSPLYTYYRILGLKDRSGLAEVKEAYRNYVKANHPDRNPNVNIDHLNAVRNAYRVLRRHLERKKK